MENKKRRWYLLAALLCFSLLFAVLAGCAKRPDGGLSSDDPSSSEDPVPADDVAPVFVFEGFEGAEIVLPSVPAGDPVVFPAVKVTDDRDGDITAGIRIYEPTGADVSFQDTEAGRIYTLIMPEAGTFETVLRSDDQAGNRGVAVVAFSVTAATEDSVIPAEEASLANLALSGGVFRESFASGSANELVGLSLDATCMYYRSDEQAIDGTSLVIRYQNDRPFVALLALREYLIRPGTLSIEFDIKLLSGTGCPQWYFGLTPLNNNVQVDLSAFAVGETRHVSARIVVDNDTPQGLALFAMTDAAMEIALDNFTLSFRDQTVSTYIPTQEEIASETGAVWDWTSRAMAVGNGEIVSVPADLQGAEGFSDNVMYINNTTNSGSDFYATNNLFVVGTTYEISFSYKLLRTCSALSGVHAGTGFNEMYACGGSAGATGVYRDTFTAKEGDERYILYGVFEAYIGDFSLRAVDPSEIEDPGNFPFEAPAGGEWAALPEFLTGQEGFSDPVLYAEICNTGLDFYNFTVEAGKTYRVSFKYYLTESGWGNWNQVHFGSGKVNELEQTVGTVLSYTLEYTAAEGDTHLFLFGASKIYFGDITFEEITASQEPPFTAPAGGEWAALPEFLTGQEGFSDPVLYAEICNTGLDFYNFTVEAGKTYRVSFKYYLTESGWGNWNQVHFGSGKVNELEQTVGTVLSYTLEYTAAEGDTHLFLFGASKIYFGDITFEEITASQEPPFTAPAGGEWAALPEFLAGQEGFSDPVLYAEICNTGLDFYNFTVEAGKTYRVSFKYYLTESGWGNWNQVHFGSGKVNELEQTVGTVLSYTLEYTAAEGDTHLFLFGASKIYFGDITFEEIDPASAVTNPGSDDEVKDAENPQEGGSLSAEAESLSFVPGFEKAGEKRI